MIWLIGLYRKFISPLKPPCCRFTPTCSAYAIEAFKKRGFFVGFILTVWRILRCNPFCRGGYDPVPERGFRNPRAAEIAANEVCRENAPTEEKELTNEEN
jgi:putative membrane protein insertion efficiency factor